MIVITEHLFAFNFHFNPNIFRRFPILEGGFGVNVFFEISGFLITSLLLKEEEDNGYISLKNFYTRRTLRIFPAYFFLLLVYWYLQLLGYLNIPSMAWLTALTYTKYLNWWIDHSTAHVWSLSIEETFYLFWPAVFLLGDKIRKNVTILLILVVPAIRIYSYINPINWLTDLSIFTRGDAIATGCLFALYRKQIINYFTPYWNKLFYFSIIVLFSLPWLYAILDGTAIGLVFISLGTLHGTIANGLIAIIMMYSVFGPKGAWYQMLNSKVFNYIGILSYSLYLWQQLFVLKRAWWVTHFPQNVGCILLASLVSYYLIEKPFLKLKSRFARKPVGGSVVQQNK